MNKNAWNRFSDEGYKHYQVIHAGFKYNMIQAAMGIHYAEWIGERTLSLPLSAVLNKRDVEDVIEAVRKVVGKENR